MVLLALMTYYLHIEAKQVICGHIHSIIASTIGGKMVLSAPSPCSTFAFNIQENAPVGFMDSGDGCCIGGPVGL